MKKILFLIAIMLGVFAASDMNAQKLTDKVYNVTPKDAWELSLSVGPVFVSGDWNDDLSGIGDLSLGGGIGIRKAIDHIFSVRVDFNYFDLKGSSNIDRGIFDAREYHTTWISGDANFLITLNNMKFNRPVKKSNIYLLVGAGLNGFEAKTTNAAGVEMTRRPFEAYTHLNMGAGVSWRINPRFNMGIEVKSISPLGAESDLVDGVKFKANSRSTDKDLTPYRDIVVYPSVRFNFNLGNLNNRSEPLYWVNPLGNVVNDLAEVKARPVVDMNDDDNDGVVNSFDQEMDSPAGAAVDVRGVALDSDGDGVLNYLDKEPYSPPGYKYNANGIAMIPEEPKITEDDVNRIVDTKMDDFRNQLVDYKKNDSRDLIDWFLPMVNFRMNSYAIDKSEYEKLYQVATVMKRNPNINVVVVGYTDKTSNDRYNNVLSYNRARAAMEHLVSNYGVNPGRLILNYDGENTNIIPTSGASRVNRRVEFRASEGEAPMGRPEGPKAGVGPKFSGNAGF